MTSQEIRQKFFDFFQSKNHKIVESAPMVIKNDPTLLFTNAGMNQFKDYFLGNSESPYPRVADTQKCLRVSGKHNDLEEVGHDTYHHTMFEMLGNWSFGDYFKKEAIDWAWEFLTQEIQLSPDRLYATVFGGDESEQLSRDDEASNFWESYLPLERILDGSKKDNFWEMGDSGPCGPCSEIHIDLRSDSERKAIPGSELVNRDHPQVVEIWNLVFIQFNRKANGQLEQLPAKHVDTGMGFERLTMAVQGKTSNYDTDIFQPLIQFLAQSSGKKYGQDLKTDIALRVISDHVRAIAFAIADGQLPSNNKAGYVIRRILRRAVRYGFTFLNRKEAFMYELVDILDQTMGDHFPELRAQKDLIKQVMREEESSFLRTLETGIKRLDQIILKLKDKSEPTISGKDCFELYDTYGFPVDLSQLIASEAGVRIDLEGFNREMAEQKARSRQDAGIEKGDWVFLRKETEEFVGYDYTEHPVVITRYRKVETKGKALYQVVFNQTPFYAESGGQVGDTGIFYNDTEQIEIIDTVKENALTIHLVEKLPQPIESDFTARVDLAARKATERNHSATHLLHHALRAILGEQVEQKGSLVDPKRLRFDFAHFQKMSREEIKQVEDHVNKAILNHVERTEMRHVPIGKAQEMGAMALFGEKYGEAVRVIQMGESVELCGGTHVGNTSEIAYFKIMSESSVASGIRRIEAITGEAAREYIENQLEKLERIESLLKPGVNAEKQIHQLLEEHKNLQKEIEKLSRSNLKDFKQNLKQQAIQIGKLQLITAELSGEQIPIAKDLAFQLKDELSNLVLLLGHQQDGKAQLSLAISKEVIKSEGLNAGSLIREVAKEIQGGGGGQAFFATAGGKNPAGLAQAFAKLQQILTNQFN